MEKKMTNPSLPNRKTSGLGKTISEHPIVTIVGVLAAIAGICGCIIMVFTFFTGSISLPEFFQQNYEKKIIGSWAGQNDDIWTFFDNGKFQIITTDPIPTQGNYSFPDKNHLQLDFEGVSSIFVLGQSVILEINISSNQMTLSSTEGELVLIKTTESYIVNPTTPPSQAKLRLSNYGMFFGLPSDGWQPTFLMMKITNEGTAPLVFPRDISDLSLTVETNTGDTYPAHFSYSNMKNISPAWFDVTLYPELTITGFIDRSYIMNNPPENQIYYTGVAFDIPESHTVVKIIISTGEIIVIDKADTYFSHPNASLDLPVSINLDEFGFPNSEIQITGLSPEGDCYEEDLNLPLVYKNLDNSQDNQAKINFMIVDSDGIVYSPHFLYISPEFQAGPGQSIEGDACFTFSPTHEVSKGLLVVYNDYGQYKLVNVSLK